MNNIFSKMNEDNIDMCTNDLKIDEDKIKNLTLKKINQNRYKSFLRKSVGIAATFVFFTITSGITTYTLAGPIVRSYIGEIFGFETGEVLLVGETISSKDYSMTVEDFIYDGANGEVTLSVSAKSNSAKESFENDSIYDKFGHFSIGYGIGELEEYNEENKRFFSISFSKPLNEYEHLVSDFNSLVFAFDGIKDMVKIPLEPTLDSFQKNILVPAQSYYPIEYTSLVYSKLGFTLIGNQVNDNESYENITIDFVLKNGDIIHFINRYYPHTHNVKTEYKPENQQSSKETVIIDGKKQHVNVVTNNTFKTDIKFISEFDDEWFAYSGGSGYSPSNNLREVSFSFQRSFDWDSVNKMIINGTEISFN